MSFFQAFFVKLCGEDKICEPDLAVEGQVDLGWVTNQSPLQDGRVGVELPAVDAPAVATTTTTF